MCSETDFLGCPMSLKELRALNDELNVRAVEQVNDIQELVMLNNFARESNESQFRQCLKERISEIASWRWVLDDLTKRLDEAVSALQYEHNALQVVVQRVQSELDSHSSEGRRPGALCPNSDVVEDAIMQEYKFLREHKKKFEKMIPDLGNQIKALKKTKKRIEIDILCKEQAIGVEETCAQINANSSCRLEGAKLKKKRGKSLNNWENRCSSLKRAGLRALSNAAITRQQVRGARTHLSIAAQAYAARVDSALRRRLHSNNVKLQDLKWQREEAMRDYTSLDEELQGIEHNLIETIEQERIVEARLLDRTFRPPGELTKDEVDKRLREELGRLKCFSKQLRNNLASITLSTESEFRSLQNHLADSMTRIDCCAEDLLQIISLDEERISTRLGEPECSQEVSLSEGQCPNCPVKQSLPNVDPDSTGLSAIIEEDEDDYPFDN